MLKSVRTIIVESSNLTINVESSNSVGTNFMYVLG